MQELKEKELYGVKFSMNSNIKEIYTKMYPYDEFGQEIRDNILFKDMWECLLDGKDIYDFLNVGDSEVRIRTFEMISTLKECNYDYVYHIWLHKGEYSLW